MKDYLEEKNANDEVIDVDRMNRLSQTFGCRCSVAEIQVLSE